MNGQQYEKRREELRRRMHAAGFAGLLVTLDANRYYLSGFELHDPQINESAGCLVLTADGRDWLCTDPRYLDAARRLWDEDRIFLYRGSGMAQINALIKDNVKGVLGFEARNISLDAFEAVSKDLDLQRADGLIEGLRMIKEPEEIERMARSCALNERMMRWLPGVLVPGRTEAQIAWDIEQFFRNHGASELAFSSIVAVDANAALPHAVPGDSKVTDNCAILVDVGCRVDDYCSDQTRTFCLGAGPDPAFAKDLELIKEAQARAVKLIRPGAKVADIYAAARGYLDDQGVGDLFTHGLGHGIGLQTHETPSLSPTSPAELQAGMVITVEPGLYRSGRCGCRWEYMVLVTEDSAKIL